MRSHSILLVDDDADLLKALKPLLETKGHRVTGASDGTEALKALERESFTLVITDVFFPGRDGIEVILERSKSNSAVRVIAMSGEGRYSSDHFLLLVKKLGADVILKKPFGAEQLFAAIDTAFAK
jgi:two-component system response regulator (stage 0 sporulation protein F)